MDLTCATAPAGPVATTPSARARAVRSALVPDLAMVLAMLTVVWCLVLFDGTTQLFRDGDTGWHIRTGERILRGEGLPRVDPYSLTRQGEAWFAWEWGADVAMAVMHRLGGLAAVAGMYAMAIGLCTWLALQLAWNAGCTFLLACFLMLPILTTSTMHWHARPHIFGWALVLLTVLLFERRAPGYAAVALLGMVWANVHASFLLLPILALIYAVSAALEPLIWGGGQRVAEVRWYGTAALVGFAATFINPYGASLHEHVFTYLTNAELLERVGEFRTFNFHAEGSGLVMLTVAIAFLGIGAAFSQRRLSHALILLIFVIGGLRSARMLPLVALVCLPLAGGAITAFLRNWSGIRFRTALDSFLRYGDRLRALDLQFSGVAAVPVFAVLVGLVLLQPSVQARAGFPSATFPVAAAERIAALPSEARIFAPDLFGGYLIYRFDGRRPVFFDGRSDFYGVAWMKEYLDMIELRPDWQAKFDSYGFTHALLPSRYSLTGALEDRGWTVLARDSVATLMAAPVSDRKEGRR